MITLGIECSSRQGSLALLKDGELLVERSWIAERVRHNTIFQTLENLIVEADVSYNDISLFAVGRGPGSFSGMRMSFAVAQALALPSKADVRAVSSGAALALAVAREGAKQVAVVGDARRGQVWIGVFNVDAFAGDTARASSRHADGENATMASRLRVSKDWKLIPYEDVSVPQGTVVVSPEAERLTGIFPASLACASKRLANIGTCDASGVNAQFPHAKEVAELAQTHSEELEPLYMHPPVFIEPKFA